MKTFTLTIDVEPDAISGTWKTSNPITFLGVTEGIKIIQEISNNYGISVTYFIQPIILYSNDCIEFLKNLQGNFELGTHLHGEYINPCAKFSGPDFSGCDPGEMQKDYGEKIERRKIRNLTSLFDSKFGYKPKSFRAGRFGSGIYTLNILKELGYTHDSSMVPFHKRFPNFKSVIPFYKDGIIEVPVSVDPKNRWLRPTPSYSNKYDIENLFNWLDNHDNINACCMFHNCEIIAGKNPYCLNDNDVEKMISNLKFIFDEVIKRKYESKRVNEIIC